MKRETYSCVKYELILIIINTLKNILFRIRDVMEQTSALRSSY